MIKPIITTFNIRGIKTEKAHDIYNFIVNYGIDGFQMLLDSEMGSDYSDLFIGFTSNDHLLVEWSMATFGCSALTLTDTKSEKKLKCWMFKKGDYISVQFN